MTRFRSPAHRVDTCVVVGRAGPWGGETPDPMDRSDGSGPEEAASAFGGEVEELFADLAGAQPRPMVPFTHE